MRALAVLLFVTMVGCRSTPVTVVDGQCFPTDTVGYMSAFSWMVAGGVGADPSKKPTGDTGVVADYCRDALYTDPRFVHERMENDQRLSKVSQDSTLGLIIRHLRGEVRKSAALQYGAYHLSPDTAFVGLEKPTFTYSGERVTMPVHTWFRTPVVTVNVNGTTLRLLFDTGAEITVINRSALENIRHAASTSISGVGGDVDAAVTIIDSLSIGNLSVAHLPVMVTTEEVLSSPWWTFWNTDPHGILGWDVISRLSFTLSELEVIEFHAHSAKLPLQVLAPTSMPVEVCINNFPALAWFDSGATYSEVGEIGIAKSKSSVESSSSTRYGVGGHSATTTQRLTSLPVSVASISLIIEDIPVDDELSRFFAYDVVFGADVLKHCRWSFDSATRTMNLEPLR